VAVERARRGAGEGAGAKLGGAVQPSPVRPYYIFTAVVLAIGAIASVAISEWSSFFIFSVLCGTAVWIAARVTPVAPPSDKTESTKRVRPSERRRQRKQQG
jgi:hypothetical protein